MNQARRGFNRIAKRMDTEAAVQGFLEMVNQRLGSKAASYAILRKQLHYWVENDEGAGIWYIVHFGGLLGGRLESGRDRAHGAGRDHGATATGDTDRGGPVAAASSQNETVERREDRQGHRVLRLDEADLSEAFASKVADTLLAFEEVVSPHLAPDDE